MRSFFAELVTRTDQDRRGFETHPVVVAAVADRMALQRYRALPLELHHVVWHFSPVCAAAAGRMDDSLQAIRHFLYATSCTPTCTRRRATRPGCSTTCRPLAWRQRPHADHRSDLSLPAPASGPAVGIAGLLGRPYKILRLMERLARSQARKSGGADESAVEELKRMELENAWGERHTGIERRVSGVERRIRR